MAACGAHSQDRSRPLRAFTLVTVSPSAHSQYLALDGPRLLSCPVGCHRHPCPIPSWLFVGSFCFVCCFFFSLLRGSRANA